MSFRRNEESVRAERHLPGTTGFRGTLRSGSGVHSAWTDPFQGPLIHVQNDNRNLCNPSAACSWPGFSRGSLIGFGLMAVAYVISRRWGYQVRTEPIGCQELFSRFKDALLALLTPAESASVAVFYALIVGMFVFRELKLKDLGPIFLRSGLVTAFIMLIAGGGPDLFPIFWRPNRSPSRFPNHLVGYAEPLADPYPAFRFSCRSPRALASTRCFSV